ncbi:protein N-lysine methyltransferase METTL21D-like [Ptychodera flava]|uniref:protein N-lysine methyltransferase METTL21D-like n=1 Tax=Ptychodera flava TaxID=63121 RepID=UPI003969DB30
MAAPSDDLSGCFVREFELKNSTVLRVNQFEVGDVGCVVWDAALVFASYLQTEDFSKSYGTLSGKSVVELGSGTGIVGLTAAVLGANVLLTDLEDFVPLLELNIKTNETHSQGTSKAQTLKWGEDVSIACPDFLFISDCIYYDESTEPLVTSITDLSDKHTHVIMSYEKRTSENKLALERKFFKLIEEDFKVETIALERHDDVFRSEDILLIHMTKR